MRSKKKLKVDLCFLVKMAKFSFIAGWVMFSIVFLRSKTAVLADKRIRMMNEVLSGIRIIKMYAWEKAFSAVVTEVRRYG